MTPEQILKNYIEDGTIVNYCITELVGKDTEIHADACLNNPPFALFETRTYSTREEAINDLINQIGMEDSLSILTNALIEGRINSLTRPTTIVPLWGATAPGLLIFHDETPQGLLIKLREENVIPHIALS